jgi:CelD/BcsL family acetyltransferase involved in cellulose biosynthesis
MTTYLAHNELHELRRVEPFVLLVRRRGDGQVIGALPLKRVRHAAGRVPFRRIEFLVASEVDLPPLLAAPQDQAEVASAIMRFLPRLLVFASTVDLIHQPEDSALFQARGAANSLWSEVADEPGMPISSIPVNFPDLATYYQSLNKKMRSNVGRFARHLAAEGQLEYLTSSHTAVTPDLFRVYLDVEARSWKRGTSASIRRHPARVRMYEQLHLASSAVTHHIDALLLKGVPIAAQVSMQYGKTVFAMETCYDESYAKVGPGNLLLFMAVARALRVGASELGLHGHFDYYKHRWLAESLNTRDIRIVRKGSFPHLRLSAGRIIRKLLGQNSREVGLPDTTPNAEAGPAPEPACQDVVARLRDHPAVMRFDHNGLQALLPFSLS